MRVFAFLRRAGDLALVRAGVALGDCTAVSVGADVETRSLLMDARLAGAGRAIQLADAALDGIDYLAVATALAAVVRTVAGDLSNQPTLLLAGDRGRGAVGPALADRLQLPLLGQVVSVERDADQRITAQRRFRATLKQYAAAPPAVVCLLVDDVAPAGARNPLDEPSTEIELFPLGRVGLSPAELSYRKRFLPHPSPGPTRQPRQFADAAALAERLVADGLVPGKRRDGERG
jgi:hypothetical protein